MRLQGERYTRVETASVVEHVRAVLQLWEWVFGNVRRAPVERD